mmetsp:Transcript_1225/g.2521  ORF Transcript_1225/g.2521 Transcript_1225/m.2521 type:complete len:248 (-) Transcript_1225:89-832(-)
MCINQSTSDVGEFETSKDCEAASQTIDRGFPSRLQTDQEGLLFRIFQLHGQLTLCLLAESFVFHLAMPKLILCLQQLLQLPQAAEPKLLVTIAFVIHVWLKPKLDDCTLRQEQQCIVHKGWNLRLLDCVLIRNLWAGTGTKLSSRSPLCCEEVGIFLQELMMGLCQVIEATRKLGMICGKRLMALTRQQEAAELGLHTLQSLAMIRVRHRCHRRHSRHSHSLLCETIRAGRSHAVVSHVLQLLLQHV